MMGWWFILNKGFFAAEVNEIVIDLCITDREKKPMRIIQVTDFITNSSLQWKWHKNPSVLTYASVIWACWFAIFCNISGTFTLTICRASADVGRVDMTASTVSFASSIAWWARTLILPKHIHFRAWILRALLNSSLSPSSTASLKEVVSVKALQFF